MEGRRVDAQIENEIRKRRQPDGSFGKPPVRDSDKRAIDELSEKVKRSKRN